MLFGFYNLQVIKIIMTQETTIKLFEDKKVRTHWDEQNEEWYFSVINVVEILTESINPRDYWFKMKQRVKSEDGIELSTICRQLKMRAPDGKMRETATTYSTTRTTNLRRCDKPPCNNR
jgi:hypothetical protein